MSTKIMQIWQALKSVHFLDSTTSSSEEDLNDSASGAASVRSQNKVSLEAQVSGIDLFI